MKKAGISRPFSLFLGDVGIDAMLLAREADVQDADLVAEGVAMDSERERGAAEISGRALHRSDDVLLLEFLRGQVQRDAVSEELVDDLLKLPIEIHGLPPATSKMFRGERAAILAKRSAC